MATASHRVARGTGEGWGMTTTRTETVANGVVFEQAMPSLLEAQGGSERLGGLERRRESLDERHCVGIVAAARGPDQANRLGRVARASGRRRGTSGQTRGGRSLEGGGASGIIPVLVVRRRSEPKPRRLGFRGPRRHPSLRNPSAKSWALSPGFTKFASSLTGSC